MTGTTPPDEPSADGAPTTPGGVTRPRPDGAARSSAARRARRIGGATTGTTTGTPSGSAPATGETSAGTASTGKPSTGKPSTGSSATGAPAATAASDAQVLDRSDEDARPDDGGTGRTGRMGFTGLDRFPAWLRWLPAVLLSGCAIAMVVVLLVGASGVWWSTPSGSDVRDRVLAAAKTCVAATNSYVYNQLAKYEKAGVACTTGAYTDNYKSAISRIVKPAATKLQASQTVQINAAGIESVSASGSDWVIVVYGQTKITQKNAAARNDPFAATVTMHHTGGDWLISRIGLITAPVS